METMEQYREADKAQKKMGKALLHNVESVITGGTNVVANGLKLAGGDRLSYRRGSYGGSRALYGWYGHRNRGGKL